MSSTRMVAPSSIDVPASVMLRYVRALEYLKTLRLGKLRIAKVPFKSGPAEPGVKSNFFDAPLSDLDDGQFTTVSGLRIPTVFYNLANEVVKCNGRTQVGIFRTCGLKVRMDAARAAMNAGEDIPKETTTSDLAGLLKLYLREQDVALLEPVREIVLAVQKHLAGDEYKIALIAAINLLPPRSYDLFIFLSKYLALVDFEASKMNQENLGLVFSEGIFYGAGQSQDAPTAKSLDEGKSLSEAMAMYITMSRNLRGLPAPIRQMNDGDDVDQVKKIFTLATSERRKRRMSLKGNELLTNVKKAAGAVANGAGRLTRRRSLNSAMTLENARALAPLLVNVDMQQAGKTGLKTTQNKDRMQNQDRESVKRKTERIKSGDWTAADFEIPKKRRAHSSHTALAITDLQIMPDTTRRGTTFLSPMKPAQLAKLTAKANPGFDIVSAGPLQQKRGEADPNNPTVIVGERADPTGTKLGGGVKRTEKRRRSMRSLRRRQADLNTSVWSTLKRSNPSKGETILDVLTNANSGPMIDTDGSAVYMV